MSETNRSNVLKVPATLIRWPALATPRAQRQNPEKLAFRSTAVLPGPDDIANTARPEEVQQLNEFYAALWAAADALCRQTFADGFFNLFQSGGFGENRCLIRMNNNPKQASKPGFDRFPTGIHFEAKSQYHPRVFNRDNQEMAQEATAVAYDGMYGNLWISLYATKNEYGRNLGVNLEGVRILSLETPRLGGGGYDFDGDDLDAATSAPSWAPAPERHADPAGMGQQQQPQGGMPGMGGQPQPPMQQPQQQPQGGMPGMGGQPQPPMQQPQPPMQQPQGGMPGMGQPQPQQQQPQGGMPGMGQPQQGVTPGW